MIKLYNKIFIAKMDCEHFLLTQVGEIPLDLCINDGIMKSGTERKYRTKFTRQQLRELKRVYKNAVKESKYDLERKTVSK